MARAEAQTRVIPLAPEIQARSYVLLDVTANQVLDAHDVDSSVEPASLTKLMTAYLVFDALRAEKLELEQEMPVSERAWLMPGSRMFIEPRMKVPVDDLLKGLIVQSGNDAAVALAEGVSGTVERFVELMNAQARTLGMTSTNFKNPTGLPQEGHVTTASDLARLAARILGDFPEHAAYFSTRKYRYKGTPTANAGNRNLLLYRDPAVDGLKTGHTDSAGYCIVATAKRRYPTLGADSKGERRLIAVVLGAADEQARANEAQKLLNWGFSAFDAVKLFDANQAVVSAPVWKGRSSTVQLGRTQPIVVAVPVGEADKLRTTVMRREPLIAPLHKGESAGTLRIYAGEHVLRDMDLRVLDSVEMSGVFGQALDALRLWMR
ncbi:MAG: D-alanyl-D-alanine carboxypeptidase [Hylemonella sp.]|nr:D-alanyl-D-alanine carboxypeptidase [Hylemonella sp.]